MSSRMLGVNISINVRDALAKAARERGLTQDAIDVLLARYDACHADDHMTYEQAAAAHPLPERVYES